jgi:hypothetical protein
VRQRLVGEVNDDLLDDGVVAMLGLHDGEIVGAIGDKREAPPVPARPSNNSKTLVFQNPLLAPA